MNKQNHELGKKGSPLSIQTISFLKATQRFKRTFWKLNISLDYLLSGKFFYLKSNILLNGTGSPKEPTRHVDDILIPATDNLNGFTDTIENILPQCHEKVDNACEKLWNYYQSVRLHIRKGSLISKTYAL